jgi:Reverse transcriptase (RNA-dependent DNA polymerase)
MGELESESEESESDEESESEEESKDESGKENGGGLNEVDIYGDDETIPRDATVEPETFVFAPSSPRTQQPADPQLRPQRTRKAPDRYSPEPFTKIAKSHVYKADTTMWNESAFIEPQSYEDAVNHPLYSKEWTAAIQEEYDSLMKNGTWELTDLPPGKNIVSCKWVFKVKQDANGNVFRFKARLVTRGFSQACGVDYFKTYAPSPS